MEVIVNRKHLLRKHGDIIKTVNDQFFAIIYEAGEKYPYHLLCIETLTIIQSYDSLPTNDDLEDDINDELDEIYDFRDSSLTLN